VHEVELGAAIDRTEVDLDHRRPGWDLDVGAVPAVCEHDPPRGHQLDELADDAVAVRGSR